MTAVEPDVTTHGPGDPELAVVGGVHGDEPSGVRAVERLREAAESGDLDLQRGIKLIIANPPAVEANERFLDTDLNRTFPGDPNGNREQRLAAKLCAETEGMLTFSIHATHSQDDPMALFDSRQPTVMALAAQLPVPYIVDINGVASGSHSEVNDVLTIEAGCQGTEAAAVTAEKLAIDFLRLTDCLEGTPEELSSAFFTMGETVPKPPSETYEFLAENFRLVEKGEIFARADDETFVADEAFYPILMSAVGYDDIFGYKGAKLGDSLEEARATIDERRLLADD